MASSSPSFNFVLIGHVDHGKSTLAGRILVDTHEVDEREVEKAKEEAKANHMESWWLAYLLDCNISERLSGKTQEYMMKDIHYGSEVYTLVDVPGHAKLITEMISGTSISDFAVLVCSVRGDELQQGIRGQSYEHLLIARGMGIGKLIVAVNKMDAVGWDMTIFEQAKSIVSKKIASFGFVSVEYVALSALSGEGVVSSSDPSRKSLMDVISQTKVNKNRPGNAIIPIDPNKFVVSCVFVNLGTIVITKGYECVLHSHDVTSTILILGIAKKKIITSKNEGEVLKILAEINDKRITSMRKCFVLRVGDTTIGVGKVC